MRWAKTRRLGVRYRFLASTDTLTLLVVLLRLAAILHSQQTPAAKPTTSANSGSSLRTAWGDPDLQGIWTDEYQTPLQCPSQFAGRELLTEEEVPALDKRRAVLPGREYRDKDSRG
jgi:hypothetical protein